MQVSQYFETKQALGGDTTIVLVHTDPDAAAEILHDLWGIVYGFERRFSRFLPGSEVSMLNRQAGVTINASEDFKLLLRASQQMSELTDGLYNPFVLPAVQRTGYLQSALPGYEDDSVEDYRNRTVVPAHALTITGDKISIPYGSALDMGGCGKGYLADKLADVLDAYQLQGYWVSLSGDMVTFGTDEDGEPWQTIIASASTASSDNARIVGSGERLHIATSGTFKRTNQVTGNWHHLIDPRTGTSASTDICLATVVAQSAIEADVLASCAVITGSTEAESFLLQRKASAGYLQMLDRSFGFGDVLKQTQSERQTTNAR